MNTLYKRFFALLFTITFISYGYAGQYPQVLASSQAEASIDLKAALNQLKREKRVNFIYEPKVVNDKQVSGYNSNENIEVILDNLLTTVGLTYEKIADNTFVIKEGKSALVQRMPAIPVSGKVTSAEDGLGIPGVNVVIKGTTDGVITDMDGNFAIEVPSENSVLVFSYISFATQEVRVGSRTSFNIEMEPDVKQLSEVVITAVGIEANKGDLGYSVQNVSADEIVNSRETNLSSALSGKIAGVQVIAASGSPGASAAVRIRGSRSINGGNEPLYVIDGLPIDNSTSANGSAGVDVSNRAIDINPNDIEKITVLKGPAATVLYGSRAANGAIMISTKKGKAGKPVVTLNSSMGISEVNKLPERQNEYAQGRPVSGLFQYFGPESGETASWGPAINTLEFDGDPTYPYDKNGRLVPAGTGSGKPAQAYDAYDAFWVKGFTYDNNLSVVGGTDAVRYYASIGNLYQSGTVPNADFARTSVKANLDFKITEKLSAGVSANYVNSGGSRIQRGSNISGVTTGLFRNTPTFDIGNGKKGYDAADDPDTYILSDGTQRAYRGNALNDNPFWAVNKNPYIDNVNRMIGNVNLGYEVFDWLKLNYKVGVDYFTDLRNFAWDINSASEIFGKVDQSVRTSNRVNSDFLILIEKQLSSDLRLGATVGHNYFSDKNISQSSEGMVLSVPNFYNIKNASQIISSESIDQRKYYGVFVDARLVFKDYLFLNLSGRNDWSSTLPDKNNSFFYPAVSLGYEFTEMFELNSNVLSYGKLRASYGQVGSAPPLYRTSTSYDKAVVDGDPLLEANIFPAMGVNAFERGGLLGNSELKPELTTTVELGGDFKLFDGKLGLDFTYYNASTENQIVTTTIPAPTGYTSITLNSGQIENKGIELALTATPVSNSNFSWDLGLNFSRNRSLVKSLHESIESVSLATFSAISSLNIVGQPYGILSGTRYRRNDEGKMVIGSDGWPLLDNTQGPIGDPNPDWLAGVRNTFNYKTLSLSFFWDIRQGGDLWNGTKAVMDYLGVSKESGDDRDVTGYVYDGVTESGEVNTTPVDFANPAQGLSGIKWRKAGTLLGLAEDNIEDGSWLRLREVTLNYALPSKWFQGGKVVSSVDLSVYGRNLILITDYKGVDPETNLRGASNDQGWDYFNLPGTRTYGISLKAVIK